MMKILKLNVSRRENDINSVSLEHCIHISCSANRMNGNTAHKKYFPINESVF